MVLDIYCEKPIAFIPSLARISGSAASGLFLSQLLYWYGKGHRKNWVYKTLAEFTRETLLSRREQENAVAIWVKLGVLEKQVWGIPPKRHFRINEEGLMQLLDKEFHIASSYNSISADEQDTTESTSENTQQRPVAFQSGRRPPDRF